MDYEKLYKEALERARNIRFGDPNSATANVVCEEIFPELKESDDERIRKAIHIYLDWLDGKKEYAPKGEYSIRDMIAWLERQGDVDKRIQEEIEKRTMQQRVCERQDYPYQPGWRKNSADNKPAKKHSVLMLTTHGVAEGEWLGEEWCQYRWSCKVKDADVLYWLHLSDLESLEKENFEQNPAWSEEDEHRIKDAIYFLNTAKKYYASTVELNACIDWLKSLKPQPHWKPTDEQIEAIKRAAKDVFEFSSKNKDLRLKNETYFKSLCSLYEQLEKL